MKRKRSPASTTIPRPLPASLTPVQRGQPALSPEFLPERSVGREAWVRALSPRCSSRKHGERVETCEACRGYLKSITRLRATPPEALVLVDRYRLGAKVIEASSCLPGDRLARRAPGHDRRASGR